MLLETNLISVVFVNALTTDLDLNVLDKDVAQPVQPPESGVVGHGHGGQVHTQVHAVNQITVAADGASADYSANLLSLQTGLYLKRSLRFARPLTPIVVQSL